MNNYMVNDVVDEVAQHEYKNNKYYDSTFRHIQNMANNMANEVAQYKYSNNKYYTLTFRYIYIYIYRLISYSCDAQIML